MEKVRTPKKLSIRAFTSLLLTGATLVMACSGLVLYVTPRGRVANWTDWAMLGLDKEQWAAVHMNGCLLFLIAAVLHLTLNWRPFWGYVKQKAGLGINRKLELGLATVITSAAVVMTLYHLPPFSTVVDGRQGIKDYWERRSVRAPVPHSEELTLAEFAGHINLSVDETIEALREEGYEIADHTITLAELATSRAVPPNQVLADIQKHFPQVGGIQRGGHGGAAGGGSGRAGGPGFGPGQGLGLGRGYGRGQGRGFGQGGGRGMRRAAGGGTGQDAAPPHDTAD